MKKLSINQEIMKKLSINQEIMKKLSIVLLLLTATLLTAQAHKRQTIPTTNDMFKVITYRYITAENEDKDLKDFEKYYTKFFKKFGYVHELPGIGYGGVTVIFDGFYKGGYINNKNYANRFVPTKKSASIIYLEADKDDTCYGYYKIKLTIYNKELADKVLADVKASGFEKVEKDNTNDDEVVAYYRNGNKNVIYGYSEIEKTYLFLYFIEE